MPPNKKTSAVTLRPVNLAKSESDLPFLRELYASTRIEELAQTGWPPEQVDTFLLQQFETQHTFYLEQFTAAEFDIIISEDGVPIGRIYVEERDDEFKIIDISLLPTHCGHGIGGRLIQNIIGQADASEKFVRIHVEYNNPAMRLYQRLGFQTVEDQGVYHLMELKPPVL